MMYVIKPLRSFSAWLRDLRDARAKAIIVDRVERARDGDFGVCRRVRDAMWEMKIDYGPGYRLYYGRTGPAVYLIVAGGTKASQSRDIDAAFAKWQLAKEGKYGPIA